MKRAMVLLLILFTASRSLPAAQPETLSLSECIQLALQNSYFLQSSHAQTRSTEATYRRDRTMYVPQLAAELGHDQLFTHSYDFRQQAARLSFDWSVGDWLLRTASAQKNQALAQRALEEEARLQVTQRVASLYIGILQTRIRSDLLQSRLELLQEHLMVSRLLWQAGTRTELDVLQTQSAISQLQEEKLSGQVEETSLRQELSRLLGYPAERTLQLQDFPATPITTDSLPQVTPETLSRNPLLQSLRLQAEAQQLRLRQVEAGLLPHLQFSGGYDVDRDPTGLGNFWSVSAGVQMPLTAWWPGKFEKQAIRADVRTLHLQESDTNRELSISLKRTTDNLSRLRETYRIQQRRLETNRQALEFATANYQAGLITNLEYLSIQKELTDTELTIQETRLEYIMGLVDLYTVSNQAAKITQLQVE